VFSVNTYGIAAGQESRVIAEDATSALRAVAYTRARRAPIVNDLVTDILRWSHYNPFRIRVSTGGTEKAMSAATSEEKAQWIHRVLGITMPAQGGPGGGKGALPTWQAACGAWRDANDAVNVQINALRAGILAAAKSGDGDAAKYAKALADIAEKGLNAITEDHRVKLQAAVMEIGAGNAEAMKKSGAKTLASIQTFQAFLDRSEKIAACDANPFGVPVAIRATLGPALRQLVATLEAARK
jgi:hypothetical protein